MVRLELIINNPVFEHTEEGLRKRNFLFVNKATAGAQPTYVQGENGLFARSGLGDLTREKAKEFIRKGGGIKTKKRIK